jgi:hypothetical protein
MFMLAFYTIQAKNNTQGHKLGPMVIIYVLLKLFATWFQLISILETFQASGTSKPVVHFIQIKQIMEGNILQGVS